MLHCSVYFKSSLFLWETEKNIKLANKIKCHCTKLLKISEYSIMTELLINLTTTEAAYVDVVYVA